MKKLQVNLMLILQHGTNKLNIILNKKTEARLLGLAFVFYGDAEI